MTAVPSPCTGVCRLDAARRQCLGCLRTLAEITAWPDAGDRERRDILAAIEKRKRTA
ncbi:DUF1289 domain-containing protein [Sphingomonas sp. EC-HK361]|uniref:DUF1289 domain-containing protein n=1 Tax=Sphingomonas sp. EC-HK361 TaxID=2038397 RepID=UPI00125FE573|nr:DUF1289 domain-containing protein [Sphingomonas sp. EC-HK361]